MAKSIIEVRELMDNLFDKSIGKAREEMEQVKQLAKEDRIDSFKPWDRAFYQEKLKKSS